MANTNKFFFRKDLFERNAARNLPHDLQWSAILDDTVSQMFSDANLASGLTDGGAGGVVVKPPPILINPGPIKGGLRAPSILGSTQLVKQDSQGTASVNVTFLISDQPNVDYELEVTKG